MRTIVTGLVALIFGTSAATGVYLVGVRSPAAPSAETTRIVVVTRDVPRGASLTTEMLSLRRWPRELMPPEAITRVEDAVDRTVWIPLVKDDPVTNSKLAEKGAGRGLAALVPQGMRAVTIQTPNVATGVAGFILPGSKVDVLLTLSRVGHEDRTGGGGAIALLQNIEILAVDQRIDAPSANMVDPQELRSITLLVTPEEATRLDLGQNKGTLSLALRNPEDLAMAAVQPATLSSLLFDASPAQIPERAIELDAISPPDAAASTPPPATHIARTAASLPPPDVDDQAPSVLLPKQTPAAPQATALSTPETAPRPVLPPIRTLRGSTSGLVHLEVRAPEH